MADATPPVHLEWVAPDECPPAKEVADAIARSIGATRLASPVEARVVVTRDGAALRAEVAVSASGATSTRSLVGESCRAVADAATLIVALAANPEAALLEPPPPPPSPPPPAPPPSTPPAAPPAVVRTAPPVEAAAPPRRALFVSGSFVLDTAQLPSVGYGGELAAGWSPAHFLVEVAGAALGPQSAALPGTAAQGASVWLAHVGGRACYLPIDASFDVGPCLGGGVEWLTARGFGGLPDQPANATAQMGVASIGGRAALRVSDRVALRLVGEAVVPLVRPTFFIDGGGVVFHTPGASFRAALGAEAHF